jgi:serine protease
MKNPLSHLIAIAAIWLALAPAAPAQAQDGAVPNELLIKLRSTLTTTRQGRALLGMGLQPLRWLDRAGVFVVAVPQGQDADTVMARLSTSSDVEYVEPNAVFTASLDGEPLDPNDYYYIMQGQVWHPLYGMNVPPAWTRARGRGVIVAVLDTGCAYETVGPYVAAPDLPRDRIVPLPDYVNRDGAPNDDNGHGTFMSTLIGAEANDLATIGIAPECILMPAKVLDSTGEGRADWVAGGMYEAVARGARIILLSANSRIHSKTVQDAVDFAVSNNVLVVCSAGNDGVNLDVHPEAAAVYAHSVVVGATNSHGWRSSYSNYGSAITLVSQGGDGTELIWSQTFDPTYPNGYGFGIGDNSISGATGTSIAAAGVAGVLALVLEVGGTLDDVIRTAHDLGDLGPDVVFGYGLPDAGAAVGSPGTSTVPGSAVSSADSPYDVAVRQIQVLGEGITLGDTAGVVVTAANNGQVFEQFKVRLYDDQTRTLVGEQTVSLEPGEQTQVMFPWIVQGRSGDHPLRAEAIPTSEHTPEFDSFNNSMSVTVNVLATDFAMTIQTYAPMLADESQGVPTDVFAAGAYLGFAVTVSDNGEPAADAQIHCTVRGATGAVVFDATIIADANGRATFQLRRYTTVGGTGTYTVEAVAGRGDKSARLTKDFEIQGRTRQF